MLLSLGILAALLVIGFVTEQICRARDRALPLTGRLVDMGGYRLHVTDQGAGGPTLVLLHGVGDSSYSWMHIANEVARSNRVLRYDRPGLGASSPGPAPDPVRTIEELHSVLIKSGAPAPYVLVGHSFGGLVARLYASRYPDQVAGIVFTDSTHEGLLEDRGFLMALKMVVVLSRVMRILAPFGIPRLLARLGVTPMYAQERKYYAQQLSAAEYRQWLGAYNRNIASPGTIPDGQAAFPMMEAAKQIMSPTQFGDLPIAVLNNPGYGAAWIDMGRELASRSTNAIHLVSDRPGHSLQMPRPELVLEAIRHVVAQVRERRAHA